MKKFFLNLKLQVGQSLVEIVLVMALSALILPALLTGFVSSRQGKVQQSQRTQAVYLLNQTIDSLRSIRERNWESFAVDGTYHTATQSGSWILASGPTTANGLTQQIIISDINRDLTGAIATLGGTLDPSSKKVNV
jgi:type II secretory pathway pseudopilin PulG